MYLCVCVCVVYLEIPQNGSLLQNFGGKWEVPKNVYNSKMGHSKFSFLSSFKITKSLVSPIWQKIIENKT